MSDPWIGMGFIAHHERKGGGIGDRVDGSVVREFCHRKKFRPFRGLVFSEDVEIGFEFLVYPF